MVVDETPLTLRRALATDFRTSTWRPRVALVGVVVWLVYEWGPGNETVTAWVVANLLERFQGWFGVVVAAVFAFGFVALQQLASGLTALLGFSLLRRTAQTSWERVDRSNSGLRAGWWSMGRGARVAVVFGLGSTAVALMQIMTTGIIGVRPHARAVASSAVLCGSLVGLLSAVVAAGLAVARSISALAGPTERALAVLSSPWPWIALAVVVLAREIVRSRRAS